MGFCRHKHFFLTGLSGCGERTYFIILPTYRYFTGFRGLHRISFWDYICSNFKLKTYSWNAAIWGILTKYVPSFHNIFSHSLRTLQTFPSPPANILYLLLCFSLEAQEFLHLRTNWHLDLNKLFMMRTKTSKVEKTHELFKHNPCVQIRIVLATKLPQVFYQDKWK